jgi:hypothetical protein
VEVSGRAELGPQPLELRAAVLDGLEGSVEEANPADAAGLSFRNQLVPLSLKIAED